MTHREVERYKHKMHHLAVFHMKDGQDITGNMQPWDDEYIYITINNGAAGGKVKISEIQRIEFPND